MAQQSMSQRGPMRKQHDFLKLMVISNHARPTTTVIVTTCFIGLLIWSYSQVWTGPQKSFFRIQAGCTSCYRINKDRAQEICTERREIFSVVCFGAKSATILLQGLKKRVPLVWEFPLLLDICNFLLAHAEFSLDDVFFVCRFKQCPFYANKL